jgi:hypothetical protein
MASSSRSIESCVRYATFAAMAMVGQQIAGRAAANTLYLSFFPVEHLPKAMAASAALSALGVFAFARVLTRRGPARSVPWLFATSGALFFLEWVLSFWAPRVSALAVYFHTALFGATLTSAFWSLVNERFDPFTARQVVNRITSGSTAGGVLGGLVAWRIGHSANLHAIPIGLGALNLATVLLVTPVARGGGVPLSTASGATLHAESSIPAILGAIRRTPYLRALALLVGLGALVQALIDYNLNAEAAATFGKGEKLLTFFALFYTATGVLSFLLQSTVTRKALEALGLAGAMSALPGSVVVALLARPFLPPLAEAAFVRGTESTVRASLYKAGYELLYTPLPQREKRRTKMAIDVGFDRVGSALGAGLTALVLLLPGDMSDRVLAGLTMALSILGFSLSRALHRYYVQALEKNLRSGVLRLDQQEVVDATTRRTLTETLDALDRKRVLKSLLAEVESLRGLSRASLPALPVAKDEGSADPLYVPTPSVPPHGLPVPPSSFPGPISKLATTQASPPSSLVETPEPRGALEARKLPEDLVPPSDALLTALADVRSGNLTRFRKALARTDIPEAVLVPHLLTALENDALTADAQRYLRTHVEAIAGQLGDAMLDRRVSLAVRRQLPRILGVAPATRALPGLLAALEDDDFDVRFRAALAASRIVAKLPEQRLSHERVRGLVLREVEAMRARGLHRPPRKADPDDTGVFAEGLPMQQRRVGLEHVFTLLSLALDREPLRLAFLSLVTDDAHLRGTALEYLTAVLPEDLKDALWPILGVEAPQAPPSRAASEISQDLESSRSSLGAYLQAIRERESNREGTETP